MADTRSTPPPSDREPGISERLEAIMDQLTTAKSELAIALLLPSAKELYEELHPQAKRGGDHSARVARCPGFGRYLANRTGVSLRTALYRIRAAERLHGLDSEVLPLCWGRPVANQIGFLARVARLREREQQLELVRVFDRSRKTAVAALLTLEEKNGLSEASSKKDRTKRDDEPHERHPRDDAGTSGNAGEGDIDAVLADTMRALDRLSTDDRLRAIQQLVSAAGGTTSANDNGAGGECGQVQPTEPSAALPLPVSQWECASAGPSDGAQEQGATRPPAGDVVDEADTLTTGTRLEETAWSALALALARVQEVTGRERGTILAAIESGDPATYLAARAKGPELPASDSANPLKELVCLGLITKERERTLTSKKSRVSVAVRQFHVTLEALVQRGLLTLVRGLREAEAAVFLPPLAPETWRDEANRALERTPLHDRSRLTCQEEEDRWALTIAVDERARRFVDVTAGTRSVIVCANGARCDFPFGSLERERSAVAFEGHVHSQIMRELGYWRTTSGEWADSLGNRASGDGPATLSERELDEIETRLFYVSIGALPC